MDTSSFKCPYCGAEQRENAKFCRNCGRALPVRPAPAASSKFCRYCGSQLTPGAKFCNNCGEPVTAAPAAAPQPTNTYAPQSNTYAPAARTYPQYAPQANKAAPATPPKKKKRAGLRVTAALLAIVILVTGFWQPGYITNLISDIRSNGLSFGGGGKESATSIFAAPETTGKKYTAKLSPENPTAKAGNVSVNMGDYTLSGQEKLTVTACKPIESADGLYEMEAYDVCVGDRHELGDYVEIRLPYDPQEVADGTELGAAHYNDSTGEWEPVMYEIDEENHEVVIITDHFSKKAVVKYKGNNRYYKSNYQVSGLKDTTDFTFDGKRFMLPTSKLLDRFQTNAALAALQEFSASGGKLAKPQEGSAVEVANATMTAASDVLKSALDAVYLKDNAYLDVGGKLVTIATLNDEACSWAMLVKANDVCTKLGLFASAAKMTYIVLDANKSKQDTLNLYLECSNYAISSSTFAPLGLAMSGSVIIGYSINKLYEAGMESNYNTVNNVYRYYNELYDGPGSIKRTPIEWRDTFIEIMDSGETGDGQAVLDEIDRFCNAFWDLDPSSDLAREIQDDCVSYYGKGATAADYTWPKPTPEQKQDMINSYKAFLADQLHPVFLSVQNYQQLRMNELFLKQLDSTMAFLKEDIEFEVSEESILDDEAIENGKKPVALYEECTIVFAPLSEHAVQDQWTFQMGKGFEGVKFKKKLLDWIVDGQPTTVEVYEKGVNPKNSSATAIKVAPFTLDRPKTEVKIPQSNVTLDMILGEYEVPKAKFTEVSIAAYAREKMSEKQAAEYENGIRSEIDIYDVKKITISSEDPSTGRFTMRVDFRIGSEKAYFYTDGMFENNALNFKNETGQGAITVSLQNGDYDAATHMQAQTITLSGIGKLSVYRKASDKTAFLNMTLDIREATMDTSFLLP